MGRIKNLTSRVKPIGFSVQSLPANPNATPRQRGRKWMIRRARLLKAKPLCAHCLLRGVTRCATEVDHVVPLFKGGPDTDANTQNLCFDCHAEKTRQDLASRNDGV